MKSVKNLVSALLLVFTLSATALAGEMPIPPAPPDPQTRAMVIAPEDGTSLSDPYAERSGETADTSDYLFFEALAALLSVY